jgi:hypothetical protein
MIIRPRRSGPATPAYAAQSVYDVHRQYDLGLGGAARDSVEASRSYARGHAPGTAGAAAIIASHGGWAHANQCRDSISSDPTGTVTDPAITSSRWHQVTARYRAKDFIAAEPPARPAPFSRSGRY